MAKQFADVSKYGTTQLVSYLTFLSLCLISKEEKLMVCYMTSLPVQYTRHFNVYNGTVKYRQYMTVQNSKIQQTTIDYSAVWYSAKWLPFTQELSLIHGYFGTTLNFVLKMNHNKVNVMNF